jgi:outer membrane protein OmpA-like peptidoglycan-associated protein
VLDERPSIWETSCVAGRASARGRLLPSVIYAQSDILSVVSVVLRKGSAMFRNTISLLAATLGLSGIVAAEELPKSQDYREGIVSLADEHGKSERFGSKLQIEIDRSKVDIEHHRLEVQMNRPAARVEVKVFGENKEILAEETVTPRNSSAGEPILVRWTQPDQTPIALIEIRGWDTEDNWVGVAIIPWSVNIPHEEVNFETDSATIRKTEVRKLQESLSRINSALERYRQLGKIQLFIAGHTDTVGTPAYNFDLSRRRAQSIAGWFVKNGLTIPVAFEGFGETALLVETKDEVDEPRNRRVDYILAIEPPVNKKGRPAAWKYLNRAK